jgi:putative spermidine/putrescine transport system substrate-binding protein
MAPRTSLIALAALALAGTTLAACGGSGAKSQSGADAQQTLTVFTDSDVNVQKLWTDRLIPAYTRAHPNVTLKFTKADASTDATQLAKLAASVKAGQAPPMDVVIDAGFIPDAATAGLLTGITTSNVPNLAQVDPSLTAPVQSKAMPYRGSAVVLAYDSAKVATPPRTLDDLIAWIKAHPGRFTYNSPSTGGSGQGFVNAVLSRSVTDPEALKTMQTGYDEGLEKQWDAGLAVLHELNPSIYQKTYPNGNQDVLNLLARGQIDMAPTWSDMFLSSRKAGTLGAGYKAASISDPSLPGGASYLALPKNSTHQQAALALMNWVLEPAQQATIASAIAGYPAIAKDKLPADSRTSFEGLNTSTLTPFFSSKMVNDMNSLWQQRVP